ncbi:IreB family regulatory phosphoprotein [Dialister pneumosintes]|jgi:Uncharacterized protein conserved in bacteria|uniref:IreB family regulatory phosphoprotein n=1 Tax=Dialister pneumosintes TaxID=39950 RepID=A0A1B3WDV1_9FIRM|nr:IreB family regulatory phosphoprotein [Dialister pneumosintes]AOH39131.1 hypothetical protein BCB69_03610 [Dialister pneumosintes]MBS6480371.1 IreB family regulatory phosphoprotein [Dialister sp.]RID94964.1 IreB family regulatory phosphoprotein [Dialister pneumosintes]CDF26974.1 putative uncharacterized protein [Dialister sp. CAG:588]
MSVTDKTILLGNQQDDVENRQAAMVLEEVFAALKEAGHNPVVQLVGYLVSGEPTYITSLHDARKIISGIERDELVEEMVRFYVKHREL